jgi:hypothetical protein
MAVRPPTADIAAPPFPRDLRWINVAMLRIDQQLGRPVLVEFWDFCRVNSLRTLPYLIAWHERYAEAGLRVIGVHSAGFEASRDVDAVRAAVGRLGVPYPVVVDVQLEIWQLYGNVGWPARYLWDQDGMLSEYHHGEGAYAETERAIQALLGVEREVVAPVRVSDAPDAALAVQTDDVEGPYSGPYEAGGVAAVLSGRGRVCVNGRVIEVSYPGCYTLIEHPRHTVGELSLEIGAGVECHTVCFTPGVFVE